MTSCGSSSIVESGPEDTSRTVSADSKESRSGCGSSGAIDSSSDQSWFSESGNAVNLVVDLSNGIEGWCPCAGGSISVVKGVRGCGASKSLDISSRIKLGISGVGCHCDN